jgi:hypothetical protein
MRKRIPARWLAVLAASAAVPALAASAAGASLQPAPHSHSAATWMVNRDDSGGNGNWAKDFFVRDLTITPAGPAALTDCAAHATSCYAFTAALKDEGTFRTIPGAYAPNQGTDPGGHIRGVVNGQMHGYGDFATFYATSQPDMRLVPHVNNGDTNPSSTWPELAFPGGTAFTGLTENPWGYYYSARVLVAAPSNPWHIRFKIEHQQWADTSATANDYGQGATAGNITG